MEENPLLFSNSTDLRNFARMPLPIDPETSILVSYKTGRSLREERDLTLFEFVVSFVGYFEEEGEHTRRLSGDAALCFIAYAKLLHLPPEQATEQWNFIQKATDLFRLGIIPEGFITKDDQAEFLKAKKAVEDDITKKLTTIAQMIIEAKSRGRREATSSHVLDS